VQSPSSVEYCIAVTESQKQGHINESIVTPVEARPPEDVFQLVEHLFRHESGKMVAILARIFGLEHLSLAEDVVQEALARALQTWPFYGVPQNPSAWLMRTSRNLALDVVRREKVFRDKEAEIVHLMDRPGVTLANSGAMEEEIPDDRLRLIFVCCHPVIPVEAQAALALRTLCGFSVTEISRAFLTTEAAIAKRLTRAKQKIREAGVAFEIPAGPELAPRLEGVLQSLYLLFNEGYKASSGDKLVREEICREAIRLAELLARHPAGDQPATHALLALMLLNAAHFPGRVDSAGNLLRLQDQDRSLWDKGLIARGMFHLARSADGTDITRYHLQAGIAACHCVAADYRSTDWERILELYDRLMEFEDSPVVALNRAVALANVHGPGAGIGAIEQMRHRAQLESYHLLYAVLGELEAQVGNAAGAAAHFRRALNLADIESERRFLQDRINSCETITAADTMVSS
jgi:RNA polymerase sigma factor (sigma-70 family)